MSWIDRKIAALKYIKENLTVLTYSALDDMEDEALKMFHSQLDEGKRPDGSEIRPYYSEDPYFKSKESAGRYASWKQKITPNSKRNKDAPNLRINGKFYSELSAKITQDGIKIEGRTNYARKIMAKYDNTFGLSPSNVRKLLLKGGLSKLKQKIRKLL